MAFLTQQKQARLIIQGFDTALPSSPDIYTAIKQVWYQAMKVLDSLVIGVPYNVQKDSAILLGLLAWHLYPDMEVIGDTVTSVYQNDPLVIAGGVVTVGMVSDSSRTYEGLSWSLPLSRLRYYGEPVVSSGTIDQAGSRVSFREIIIVNLGNMTRRWWKSRSELPDILAFLVELRNYFKSRRSLKKIPAWIDLIGTVAKDIIRATGKARADAEKLIEFGRRVGSSSTGSTPAARRAFGLDRCEVRLRLLRGSHEEKIEWIRNQRFHPKVHADECLIAYTPDNADRIDRYHKAFEPGDHGHIWHPDWQNNDISNVELATLRPQGISSDRTSKEMVHRRWVPANESVSGAIGKSGWYVPGLYSILSASAQRLSDLSTKTKETCGVYTRAISVSQAYFDRDIFYVRLPMTDPPIVPIQGSSPAWRSFVKEASSARYNSNMTRAVKVMSPQRSSLSKTLKGLIGFKDKDIPNIRDTGSLPEAPACRTETTEYGCPMKYYIPGAREALTSNSENSHYSLLYQFSPDIALYEKGRNYGSEVIPTATFADLIHALQKGTFDDELLEVYLTTPGLDTPSGQDINLLRYLDGLTTASYVYSNLGEAYVELSTALKPIQTAKWAVKADGKITRGHAFSCVAWFESNGLDIDPKDLQHVMAVSVRDSLFVAESLVRDPSDSTPEHVIRRAVGNVGRSGMAFLVSPTNLLTEKPDYSSWRLINHTEYDGQVADNFKGTTLHLGFTGYELPLNTSDKGLFDVEVFFLETVIRAFDRGKWVTDINPLIICDQFESYNRPKRSSRFDVFRYCEHDAEQAGDYSKFMPLSSVDNWNELLDTPSNSYIIRANENWLARLAIAALEVSRMKEKSSCLRIVQNRICWACMEKQGLTSYLDSGLVILC